jgi:hypothetical protein
MFNFNSICSVYEEKKNVILDCSKFSKFTLSHNFLAGKIEHHNAEWARIYPTIA